MDLEYDITELLDGRKAHLLDEASSMGLQTEKAIARVWSNIPNRFLESLAADVVARRYEQDPITEQRTYSGKWRIVRVDTLRGNDGAGRLIERLAYGLGTTTAEADARLASVSGTPDDAGFVVQRYWPHIDPQSADDLVSALQSVLSYTNPQADSQSYTGTFWNSKVSTTREDDGSVTIVQTLTKTSSTTAEDDAVLVKITGNPGEYKDLTTDVLASLQIKRAWPYILPTAADGLLTTLAATPSYASSVKADGESYSGKFIVGEVASEKADDGTVTITQIVTRVKVVGEDENALGTPFVNADKETLNYLGFNEGTGEHIYHKYTNLDPAGIATWMTQSITVSGYTIVKREMKTEADNTATLYVVFEKDTWAADTTAINVAQTDSAGYQKTVVKTKTGLTKTGSAQEYTDFNTPDSGYVIKQIQRIEKANGEYEVRQVQGISSTTITAEASVATTVASPSVTKNPVAIRTWHRIAASRLATLIGSGGAATAATFTAFTRSSNGSWTSVTYRHQSVSVDDNGDGTYDVTQVGKAEWTAGGIYPYSNTTYDNVRIERYARSGVQYYRHVTETWEVRYSVTKSGALAEVTGDSNVSVSQVMDKLWEARGITAISTGAETAVPESGPIFST